jgi:hypothetical protein
VARNSAGDCTIASGVTSLGHNLSSDGTCGLSAPGDLSNVDPQLGPLADNGGPGAPRTLTHALLPGSPAIDAGDNAGCPPSDQRFDERPMDGSGDSVAVCDIGSYEGVYFAQGVPSPASPGPGASPVDLPRSGGHSADGGESGAPPRACLDRSGIPGRRGSVRAAQAQMMGVEGKLLVCVGLVGERVGRLNLAPLDGEGGE